MENELISKKDLLELTGISYGQLYRWKRKKLIPEDWFIRKSTFTGQETFFPKARILERINKIQNMKDDLSLDDIAEVFSPELSDILMTTEELMAKKICSQSSLDVLSQYAGDSDVYTFEKILYLSVLDKFLGSGAISLDEGKNIIACLMDNYKNLKGKQCEVIFLRKMGVGICIIASLPNEFYLEKSTVLVQRVNILHCIELIKSKVD